MRIMMWLRAWRPEAILSLILLFAVGLRLYNLGSESLWLDEGFSANMAQNPSLQAWRRDVHPPLYYALLALWSSFFNTDYWLRLLSVIFGVATIPVVYSLGRKMFGPKAALWSAAALAVLSFHVRYSQEARMYTLMALLFACAFWGLVSAARDNSPKYWLVYALSSALLAYCQGTGIIYVGVLAMLFPLCARSIHKPADWLGWLVSNAVVGILFLPWAGVFAQRASEVAKNFWVPIPSWSDPLHVLHDLTVASIPSPSTIAGQHFGSAFSLVLPDWFWVLPIASIVVWTILRSHSENQWAVRTLVAAYVLPILLIFVLSLTIKPIFLPRVLLPTAIPLVLLIGAASALPEALATWKKAVFLLGMFLLLASTFYHLRYVQKEQWRQVSEFLQQHIAPGEVVLYNVFDVSGKYLINRYDAEGGLRPVGQIDIGTVASSCTQNSITKCLEQAVAHYPAGTVSWVVSSHDQYMTGGMIISTWIKRGFSCETLDGFTGVRVARCTLVKIEEPMGKQGVPTLK